MNLLIASLFIIVFDCKIDQEQHTLTGDTMEYCESNYVDDCSGETIHDYQSEGHIVVECYEDEPVQTLCECTTDMECAQMCGGNGNPDPYALDANRDPYTGEELKE